MTEVTSSPLLAPADRLVTLPSGLPQHTLGYEAIRWATTYLRHPDGPRAGQRWEFVESQVRFVLWWYALDRQTGRWVYDHGVRRLAKGSGKALALDTPLPTPSGWTTMGEIRPGDELLDENGQSCTVLAATEVMHDRPCYRVCFSDGTEIVADADHQWVTWDLSTRKAYDYANPGSDPYPVNWATWTAERSGNDHYAPGDRDRMRTLRAEGLTCAQIGELFGRSADAIQQQWNRPELVSKAVSPRTTAEMSGNLRAGGGWNHAIPAARPIVTAEADLPIDPYVLGYLLGDGDTRRPNRVACDPQDQKWLIEEFITAGYDAGPYPDPGHFSVRGLNPAWRSLGLHNGKMIPAVYQRGSIAQRLALVQGLVDSDGNVDGHGNYRFTNTNRALVDGFRMLVASLGCVAQVHRRQRHRRGVACLPSWDVIVPSPLPLARLPRKAIAARRKWKREQASRYVTAVEPVPSVPVRCVSVSSPSSLYLAGEGLIPTHNSPIAAVLALVEFCAPVRLGRFDDDAPGGCIGKPVPMPLVQIAATSENQTANTQRVIRAMTVKGSRLVRDHDIDPGKTVMYRPGGGQLEVITSSAAAAEGALPTYCVCDETEHWRPANGGVDLSQVLARNLSKTSSRAIETCNAWEPGAGSVAEETFDAWVAEQEGRTKGGARTLYDARVAPPDTDLADDESLRAGIAFAYGDCWWVDQETIRNSLLDPRTPVDVGRRFYLNQPVASQDAWSTPQEWAAIADPAQVMANVSDGDEIVAFFDGSRTRDATALMACHVESGDVFTIDVWEPPTGSSHSPGAYEIPVDEVDAAVARMFDRWDVRAFFADVREWEGFVKVTWPERYADQLELHAVPSGKEPQAIAWDMRTRSYDFTMSCELTLTEIQERAFRHDGDSRVGRHVVNCRRHPNRWGVSVAKESRDSPKKIDAAVCVIGVRMARRLLLAARAAQPVKKPRSGRVHGFA